MNRERLTHLVTVLRRVHDERKPFAMGNWATDSDHPCGTAACAFGWAAFDPEFQKQGLNVEAFVFGVRQYFTLDSPASVEAMTNMPGYSGFVGQIRFEDNNDFYAAMAFFELDENTALMLFMPSSYPTSAVGPLDVVERVEELLGSGP